MDLTHDLFLGGRLRIAQPRRGYRAGIDPVLLAASCPARNGESILDLGCGVGVAALCVATRVQGVALAGVELQADYAALAQQNAQANGRMIDIAVANVADRPMPFHNRQFHHVIMNPPYFTVAQGNLAHDTGRAGGRAADMGLNVWIDTAARRLRPKGTLTIIQRIERLPDILSGLNGRLGSCVVQPLAARIGRAPHLMLLQARKGGRAAFQLLHPAILHAKPSHENNGEDYTPKISSILRDAAEFTWTN